MINLAQSFHVVESKLDSYILENNEPDQDWLYLADMNDDGQINVQDVILIVNLILE